MSKPKTEMACSKQDLIMKSISKYFIKHPENMARVLPILNGKTNLSLRLIDWFVTNYSKRKNTQFLRNGSNFNVYLNYKAQLKAYSKKLFDPFCRANKNGNYNGISFYYDIKDHNKFIETTVGQVNFFKWAICTGVLDYIIDHLHEIIEDIDNHFPSAKNGGKKKSAAATETSKDTKVAKTSGKKPRTKKSDLSITATKSVSKDTVKIVVSFD